MKTNLLKSKHGFTLIELIVVIVALGVLGAMLIPAHTGHRASATRITCVNNLKQVGLAFRIWAGDHNNLFPMSMSATNGGVMELALTGNVAAVFQVMSNELSTPKILFCPTDKIRQQATIFVSTQPSNTNISYFVNLDAVDTNPSMFLAGDDNLLLGGNPYNPLSGTPVPSGVLPLTTNSLIAWSEVRHKKSGDIALADGSVQQFSSRNLRQAWEQSGVETNRLVMP